MNRAVMRFYLKSGGDLVPEIQGRRVDPDEEENRLRRGLPVPSVPEYEFVVVLEEVGHLTGADGDRETKAESSSVQEFRASATDAGRRLGIAVPVGPFDDRKSAEEAVKQAIVSGGLG